MRMKSVSVLVVFSLLFVLIGCGGKTRAGEDVGMKVACLFENGKINEDDAQKVEQAYAKTPDGYSFVWKSPSSGIIYRITPTNTYLKDGRNCRDADIIATADKQSKKIPHTACCDIHGNWHTRWDSLSANLDAPRYCGELFFIGWEYHVKQQMRKFLINKKKRIQ